MIKFDRQEELKRGHLIPKGLEDKPLTDCNADKKEDNSGWWPEMTTCTLRYTENEYSMEP